MTGSLLDEALAGDPGRPFVTYYDDATGERVELSVATTDNWVAKTCGLLVDGLGVQPGEVLRLDLPRHWQLPVWALAAWRVGLVVDLDGDRAAARLAVCGPDGVEAALAAEDAVALSLRPMGAPFAPGELPPPVLDYGREVGGYGDHFSGPAADPFAAAVRTRGTTYTLGEVRERAAGLAAEWGLRAGGRLHLYVPLDPLAELLAETLVPLGADGSVVLSRGSPDEDLGVRAARLAARGESERTTADAG